ncbi:MAG: xylulokinase [Solirubrobacterales bacterium]|nr:xylulokinase [Solirubrobacterales bacterium]
MRVLGLDVGTTAVKAIALSPDGDVLARAQRPYPLSMPRPGWAEQDPEDWWRASQEALAEVTDGDEVAGIGLSGQMHGLVALDGADRVIRPAILWNDQRTQAECDEIERRVGRARLIALTGNRALTGFTAPKLLWLARHEPDAYARIAHVLLPKDYVRLRLTGEHATDVADASGMLLLDVAAREWSDEVLEALEVPREWLATLHESVEGSGRTRDSGVVVAAGAGDQAAGALGVGVVQPGPLSIVLGTSGVVFASLDAFAADPDARVHAFCHAVPNRWSAMGVMLSAAGSLAWLRSVTGNAPYDELLAEAARWEPGADGLTFLPYLAGERTPHADPGARGSFTGLSLHHDRGALVRAVLEGVACGLRDCLDLVSALGSPDVPPTLGRISGGGARGELWTSIVASVLGLPLQRVAVEEGAAYGAALLGGVAGGVWADAAEAVATCVRPGATVEPVAAWIQPYRELALRYRALYPVISHHERPPA